VTSKETAKPMKTHNAKNERIKRQYFTYLKEAKRYSETSLDGVANALHGFEAYTKFRDFKNFHIGQAVGFKRHLAERVSLRTKERLSKATLFRHYSVYYFHYRRDLIGTTSAICSLWSASIFAPNISVAARRGSSAICA
jgi:hypothetical protein